MASPYPPPQGPGGGIPASKVEIRVSCQKLVNKDALSKSDPFVVCFVEQVTNPSMFLLVFKI